MSDEPESLDQGEAQRLIETALGTTDLFAEVMDRATSAADAFTEAAQAYAAADLLKSAQVLEDYVSNAKNRPTGVHDLCASGAAIVAAMFAGRARKCTEPGCDCGVLVDLRLDPPADEGAWMVCAVACINAAADKNPDVVSHNLATIYEFAGTEGLGIVVTSMVHAHMKVAEMVARLD